MIFLALGGKRELSVTGVEATELQESTPGR
jgi:hypothetical protein